MVVTVKLMGLGTVTGEFEFAVTVGVMFTVTAIPAELTLQQPPLEEL